MNRGMGLGAAFVMLAFVSASAAAQKSGLFAEDVDWKEQAIQFPEFPRAENLVRIAVSGSTRFEFLVDVNSVSVGSDGVVRYSLVARSRSGGENFSYEGIRCRTRERKIYAIGRVADKSWGEPSASDWVDFRGVKVNAYHDALASQFFCIERTTVPDAATAIQLLKRG